MSIPTHRRKICEIESEKENYQRHLDRLEKLKMGHSPEQLKRDLEEKRLVRTINQVRKMHTFNRDFRIKEMKSLQKAEKSKQRDYTKIKSVVKNNISKLALTVAPKHKRNYQPIIDENEKILQRILQAKSNLNISSTQNTHRATSKGFSNIAQTDFSIIYEQSHLNKAQKESIKVNLTKGHTRNTKIIFQFEYQNLQEIFKEMSQLYLLEFISGNQTHQSDNIILGELHTKKLVLKVSNNSFDRNGITIKFWKVLHNKLIMKGIVEIAAEELREQESELPMHYSTQSFFYLEKKVVSNKGKFSYKTKLQLIMRKIIKTNRSARKLAKIQSQTTRIN